MKLKKIVKELKEVTIWEFLKFFFIIAGIASLSYLFANASMGYTINAVSAQSNSMWQEFKANCLIVYQRQVGEVKEGDILIYNYQGISVIHRMIGFCNNTVKEYDYNTNSYVNVTDIYAYKIKGDSPFNGEECVYPYDVKGKLIYKLC